MDKKTKMADEVPSWNIRSKNHDFTINTVIFKSENITQEISDELKKRLSIMSRYVSKNLLWSEMNTMKTVIYKHHNQHRKERYFQGLERIQKHLVRLRAMKLETLLSSFVENMPKKSTTVTSYPCVQTIEQVLFNFMGAAKLISQAIGHCKSTMNFAGGHLSKGFFITFHIVLTASLSRIWILLKDFLYNILDCYQKLHPWLGLLQETAKQRDRNLPSKLPTCLKTWLLSTEPDNTLFEAENRKSVLVTPQTSVVLEKLFSFTPASEQSTGITFTESFDKSLNYTGSLLDASEPVPRELFQDVSTNNTTQLLERCDIKHKLKPEIEFHSHKRSHFDVEPNHETTRMVENNGGNRIKERPYEVIHCPNKMSRYSTARGTFKITPVKTKRIICNPKMFESKVKRREMLRNKGDVQQLHKHNRRCPAGYRKKRILINVKCSKSNCKMFFKMNKKECQRRWETKISSVIRQRKLGVLKNQNLKSWNNATRDVNMGSTLAPNLDSSYLDMNRVHHGKDSEEQSFVGENPSPAPSDVTSKLENMEMGGNALMSRKEENDQTFKSTFQESQSCNLERKSYQSLIAKPNGKILQHQSKDDVDDIFDLLGV